MTNQIELITDFREMSIPQLVAYKEFVERLFERVRDTHFDQVPVSNQVPEAWRTCVNAINAIQEALFLKQH
jgi:hypothetical protein